MGDVAKANEIETRLTDFAVRVIKLSDALPKTPSRRHIDAPLLRSGISPAPNYAEASGAESTADFVQN
jgi:four helix bundle protein